MFYEDEDEYYFEPGEAEIVLSEFAEKMKSVLLVNVKTDIDSIKAENEKLKLENDELKAKERAVYQKEQELKYRENDLERLFFQKKFSELLTPLVEKYTSFYVDYSYKKRPKCSNCNENRKIIFTSPQGKTIEQSCECAGSDGYYHPKQTELEKINLWKDRYDRKFVVTPQYENRSDDDNRWSSLKLKTVIDVFDKESAGDIRRYESVFSSKEECQKYCDYLNSKE